LRIVWTGKGLFIVGAFIVPTAQASEIFEHLGIEYGRTDSVHTHRPLAKVDFAASVAAKREIFILSADQHAARRAAENFNGFLFRGHPAIPSL